MRDKPKLKTIKVQFVEDKYTTYINNANKWDIVDDVIIISTWDENLSGLRNTHIIPLRNLKMLDFS